MSLVVLAHADVGYFAGGFIGVDVFFVLSGFLITGLLLREQEISGRIGYFRFLAGRLKRLLPALACMLFIVALLSELLLPSFEARVQTASLVYAATWTSNFYFALSEFDYFAQVANRDLFLHTWSLGVEEQFYLLWPLLIGIILQRHASGMAARRHAVKRLMLLMSVIACGGVLLSWYWSHNQQLLSFYMMPGRASQFAVGAMVAIVLSNTPGTRDLQGWLRQSRSVYATIMAAGLAIVVGSAAIISPYLRYPDFSAIFPTAGAAMVILGGSRLQGSRVNLILGNRAATWVGDRSYSIYLWHWPVILLLSAYGFLNNPTHVVFAIVLSLVLASLSYRYIEKPFWKGALSAAAPPKVIAVSVSTMLSAALLAVVLQATPSTMTTTSADHAPNPRFDLPAIYGAGNECDSWYRSAAVRPCFLGASTGQKTAILLGDSVGAQWTSVLPELYPAPAWRSIVLTKSACPIVDQDYYYDAIGDIYDICREWRQSAIDFVLATKPEVLIVGSSSHYGFTRVQWLNGLEAILEQLHDEVHSIILIPGTPNLDKVAPHCAMSASRIAKIFPTFYGECTSAPVDATTADVSGYLVQLAEKYSNVHLLDLNILVCPDQRCSVATESGVVKYRDNRHLTNTFVMSQVPEIRKLLAEQGLDSKGSEWATAMGPE